MMTTGVLHAPQRHHALPLPRASALAVMTVACIVLIGWKLDIDFLKSGIPGLVPMNPVTAISLILAAVSLVLLDRDSGSTSDRVALRTCALIVVILPLLSLSRLYLPWDLGPDRLLFPGRVILPVAGFPNRMAPITGAGLVLFGITFLLLPSHTHRHRRIASALVTIAGLVGLVVIVNYGYSTVILSSVGGLIPVALNTAAAFLILAVGVLSARRDNGVAALVTSTRLGGMLARRLLPAAFVIPLTIGWLELQGAELGWYDHAGGAALLAIATTMLLASMIWYSAVAIDRADEARTRAEADVRNVNEYLEVRVAERTHALELVNSSLKGEVSARRRAEDELRHAAEELRGWFEASPLAMCSITPENVVVSWNRAAEVLFQWSPAEVVGQTLPIVSDDARAEADGLTQQVLAGTPVTNFETKRLRKDGKPVSVSISTAALHDATGAARGILAVYADVSHRKLLESQLRQAQKMEAVGQLAGGVAHDFNNILTVIQAAAEFLLTDIPADDPRRVDATEIANAARRAARLTRQLLAFSRQQVLELHVLDINTVVEPLKPMLRRLLPANVELKLNAGTGMDLIKADPNQLDQVVLNLVVNARDAMPDGGTILIETCNVVLDDEYPRSHLNAQSGPHVMLSVTDTGVGMDAETQARIFEPFFTTKPIEEGTGLGLSTVYGIVKQLGGHLWVYSELGHGATFKVYFPSFIGRDEMTESVVLAPATVTTAGARILLVEDDPAVRSAVRMLLERNKYTVTDVASADLALEQLQAAPDSADLVLSDMIMAGITGLELRLRLRKLGIDTPVLLMSGYSQTAMARLGGPEQLAPHIEKPFTADKLVKRIEELLRDH